MAGQTANMTRDEVRSKIRSVEKNANIKSSSSPSTKDLSKIKNGKK